MDQNKNIKVIITGASSGIGEATAYLLAAGKASLMLVARNYAKLKVVASRINDLYPDTPTPIIWSCDITNDAEVEQMKETCRIILGCPDVLINNAGSGVYGSASFTSLDDCKQVMEVNFFGALRCIKAFLPLMKACNKGHIINISSTAAHNGIPYLGAYGASKAALASLNQSLRAELYNSDIKISIVYPGYTDTDFFVNEKNIGDAIRPTSSYMPVEKVASAILKLIQKGEGDQTLSMDGRILLLLKGLFPGILQNRLRKMAQQLSIKQ